MSNIRLVAMDLDGTLLTTDKKLTEENRSALERAAEAGIHLVPATGRIFAGLPEEIRAMSCIRYMILANGATVLDRETDMTLYQAEMDANTALEVMQFLDGFPVIYDCYQNGQGWMTASMYELAEWYAPSAFYLQHIRTLRKPVPDLKDHIRQNGTPVQKIQAFCQTVDTQSLLLKQAAIRFPALAVSTSVTRNIEINDGRAHKGAALQALAGHLGLAAEETMAFGDGINDISMLQAAGLGVAMANAAPDVLAVADAVAPGNDENGVSRMLNAVLFHEKTDL